jgi:hypothetical protein
MTRVEKVTAAEAARYTLGLDLRKEDRSAMEYCLLMSSWIWIGLIDDKLACIWGLIPPTLISDRAYLWLYTTDVIKEHSFVLVRHSQLIMEEMLKKYSSIYGHALVGNDKAIRWLKWLGAKFGEPEGAGIPFKISRSG